MLHVLRKLKVTFGRTLACVLLLTWLGTALQPCVMAGSPATHHMNSQTMGHDCCPPASGKQTPQPKCTAQGCTMQAIDQQQTDLQQFARLGVMFIIALLLTTLAWPSVAPLIRKFSLQHIPPPQPHPTLAYCTLLI